MVVIIAGMIIGIVMFVANFSYPLARDRMKQFIRTENVQCERLSFLRFRLLLREFERREDFYELYRSYPGDPCFEYESEDCRIRLQTDKVMLGYWKFVYFNMLDHAIYLIWLTFYTNHMSNKRDFKSKFVKGLFKESDSE